MSLPIDCLLPAGTVHLEIMLSAPLGFCHAALVPLLKSTGRSSPRDPIARPFRSSGPSSSSSMHQPYPHVVSRIHVAVNINSRLAGFEHTELPSCIGLKWLTAAAQAPTLALAHTGPGEDVGSCHQIHIILNQRAGHSTWPCSIRNEGFKPRETSVY